MGFGCKEEFEGDVGGRGRVVQEGVWFVVWLNIASQCSQPLLWCVLADGRERRNSQNLPCCLKRWYCSATLSFAEADVPCVSGLTAGTDRSPSALSCACIDCSCFRLFCADDSIDSTSVEIDRRSGRDVLRAVALAPAQMALRSIMVVSGFIGPVASRPRRRAASVVQHQNGRGPCISTPPSVAWALGPFGISPKGCMMTMT